MTKIAKLWGWFSGALAALATVSTSAGATTACPTLARLGSVQLPPLDRADRFAKDGRDVLERNATINADYLQQAIVLDAYLGYDLKTHGPPNWWALAHSASSTVGRALELMDWTIKLLDDIGHGNINDLAADKRYVALAAKTPGAAKNGARYMKAKLDIAYKSKDPKVIAAIRADLEKVYVGFIAGNFYIYREEGEVMTRFLKEAAASPTCAVNIDGLRTASQWKEMDPYGLVQRALHLLVTARTEVDSRKKAELIHRSSMLIGFQEQWMLQVKIYDAYKLVPIFESFRTDLADAYGEFELVDDNWAEFPVRMGIRGLLGRTLTRAEFDRIYKSKGAYTFTPDNLPKMADGPGSGTIPEYFRNRLTRTPTTYMFIPLPGARRRLD